MVLEWEKTKFKWNNRVYRPTHILIICLWSTLDLWEKRHRNIVEEKCFHLMCLRAHTCLILCEPTDCNPPGSSVYGIFQARILEWVVIPSSRGSSKLTDRPPSTHTEGVLTLYHVKPVFIHDKIPCSEICYVWYSYRCLCFLWLVSVVYLS